MEVSDGILASVAQCIEQLRKGSSSTPERVSSLKLLLDLIETRENAYGAVGSHLHAVPVLVSLLRSGPMEVKIEAANVLGSLCRENEQRVRVLLGGCIPPLLGLLKSSSTEGQVAAANTLHAVSQDGARDNVGSKIFSTEGVVPALWELLKSGPKLKATSPVDHLLTGALKNLSSSTKGFCDATMEAGGVEMLMKLLSSEKSGTQANVCFLLAYMIIQNESICPKLLTAEVPLRLLELLGPDNEGCVRAEAANALKSLSARSNEAKKEIANAKGIPALINATIAPSKEFMSGEFAQALQENAMCALANISGGLSSVISSLGQSLESCSLPEQIADTIGALASGLVIYDGEAESTRATDPVAIEQTLIKQFVLHSSFMVQERTIEALAILYGNAVLCSKIQNSEAKRLLVGLITMATSEVQGDFIRAFLRLCGGGEGSLWCSLEGRSGVQLLICLLGLSSESQQECAVGLLALLSKENDESKWAITAAGGIPPLVRILETGSVKSKEESAMILRNLCRHSEDIRACVESANAVPALLWLLKNGSANGREIAAKTLNHLIHKYDSVTISQLTALLTSDLPESKVHVLDALKSMLSMVPLSDISRNGSAANDAVQAMIGSLNSSKEEETRAKSASSLADIFNSRKDLRESDVAAATLHSVTKLLGFESERIVIESSRCMAAIFLSVKENPEVAVAAQEALSPLIVLANSVSLQVAEQAVCALANLVLDGEFSGGEVAEQVLLPATRVLRDGTYNGKIHAAASIARLLDERRIDSALMDSVKHAGTVTSLVSFLASASADEEDSVAISAALNALAVLSRSEASNTCAKAKPTWGILIELPAYIVTIVSAIAREAAPVMQDNAIEILSYLCRDQDRAVGEAVVSAVGCVSSIAKRVIDSANRIVKIGGSALLVCATKYSPRGVKEEIDGTNIGLLLVHSLVATLGSSVEASRLGSRRDENMEAVCIRMHGEDEGENGEEFHVGTSVIHGHNIICLLLALLARLAPKSRTAMVDAEAVEIIVDQLLHCHEQYPSSGQVDDGLPWVYALLLAILLQDGDMANGNSSIKCVPVLSNLLKSDEYASRYFAAQAIASIVCNGSRGMLLSVTSSGAVGGLISFLGAADADISDLLALSEEFSLVRYPDQLALKALFEVEDVKLGPISRKVIPVLVDLLKPIPDRPAAPFLALQLLVQLAEDCPSNKICMVENGALEALTKYLSLGLQDAAEEAATDLLGNLFSTAEIRKHESAYGAVNQLVAVLRLGGRGARYNAAKALERLFSADHIRNADSSRQAVQPLVEILNVGSEKEQQAAIAALISLLNENPARSINVELNTVDVLCRILSSNCSVELKGDTAELCGVLFGNNRIRSTDAAARSVEPLVSLLATDFSCQQSVVFALEKLADDEQLAELVAAHGAVIPLVDLLTGSNFVLHESISRTLVKLGKDRPACKMEMVKVGIFDCILAMFSEAPSFLCAAFAELLRILTNNAIIAKGRSAALVVEPIFQLLTRFEFGSDGLHSALQVLVNILENPECRVEHSLSSHEAVEPLIPLLDSPSPAVQQLAAELLSYLLTEEELRKDRITQQAIGPLVRVVGSGMPILQQKALRALVCVAQVWANEIVKEGGVCELSKLILQANLSLPRSLWESAASVLAVILQFSSEFFLEVPIAVLVRLLGAGSENTVVGALNALLVLESDDGTSAEAMAESGAIEALLELLRCHQCEETASRLLEALLNNAKVREFKAAKSAILPLSQYLVDPQSQVQQARFLAVLALGDLFQTESLARCSDSVSASRALVTLLEEQPSEEMKFVAICALQNLVMCSRTNKRAVAEAGGIQVVLDLIGSSDQETSTQAAAFIKIIFSNHTVQEYASTETVRTLTAAIEKDMWGPGIVNDEYLRTLNVLFCNFPRLRAIETTTLSVPHLVSCLKFPSEPVQEASLETLFLLRQAWTACPAEVSRAQSTAAADAIPLLQYFILSGPSRFQEKAEFLLQCLPGTLVVVIKSGTNMKQSVGNPCIYCKLVLGNTPPQQTKVVSTGPNPEWNESFSWSFESPPKGQKLHISCKNKSKMGKSSFGKVTIQIDRVVVVGEVSGVYTLLPESKSGPARNLVIDFQWSNK